MTISAGRLRVVIGLVRVAAGASLSLCRSPLVRKMTRRAVRRGVGRLEMQLSAVGMAGNTRRDRL